MQTEFARAQMITQQVRAWDVLDLRVLDAMRRTPREFFVPERYAGVAFADTDIPLAPGQHMLPPKIVGRLLQALAAAPGMRALVVGCGTGFVPACLSAMGASVRAIEIRPELAQAAQRNLQSVPVSDRSRSSRVTLSTWISVRAMRSLRYVAPCPCTTIVSLVRWRWAASYSSWWVRACRRRHCW